MKHPALYGLFFSLPFCLFSQAPTCDYNILMREGKTYAKGREYKKALYKYNSARRCDPTKGDEVNAAIEVLLDLVEGEKKAADQEKVEANKQRNRAETEKLRAIKALARADSALIEVNNQKKLVEIQERLAHINLVKMDSALKEIKRQQLKNEKIVGAIDFYAGRFALVGKNKKYGYIDKEGNALVPYRICTAYCKARQG